MVYGAAMATPRTQQIAIRLSDAELRAISRKANAERLPMATAARRVLLEWAATLPAKPNAPKQ